MSKFTNITTAERVVEARNSRGIDRAAEFFHHGFTDQQTLFEPVVGRDASLADCEAWFTPFPDFRVEAVPVLAAGNLVCLESVATLTRVKGRLRADPSDRHETVADCDVLALSEDKIIDELGCCDVSILTGLPTPNAVPVT